MLSVEKSSKKKNDHCFYEKINTFSVKSASLQVDFTEIFVSDRLYFPTL